MENQTCSPRPVLLKVEVGRIIWPVRSILGVPLSDPAEYMDFVKQYAIWTTLEHWDLRTFAEQFTARTKKVFESLKRPWTRDVESQVRAMVPGRWADVQAVVHEAGARINGQRR